MTGKRFKIADYPSDIEDTVTGKKYAMSSYNTHMEIICDLLNELHEENMILRAKNTQFVIILKDVVNDLKRMDTYRYAEHLEKIANLHFLSEKELEDE